MKFLALLLIALPLTACSGEEHIEISVDPVPAKTTSISTNVQCGCTIDSISKCGNFVEIDSKYIPIANDKELGLGHMEWCNQGPVAADVAGEVVDGAFVASKLDTK